MTFVPKGNHPLPHLPKSVTSVEVRDLSWFTKRLQELKVCSLYIAWGNHEKDFTEINEHLMDLYLHRRGSLFHEQALFLARADYEVRTNYPWPLG
jgi:hypothetical protein